MPRLFVPAVLAAVLCSSSAFAVPYKFMDIDFDGDTSGAPPSEGPMTPSPGNPITTVWATGGYYATGAGLSMPPDAGLSGTIRVQNVAGMNKAAVLTTVPGNGELGALWMDTGFSLPSQTVTLAFDVAVLNAPAVATAQPKYLNNTNQQVGILLGMNTYSSAGWAFRFAVAPTGDGGGVFAMRSPDNTQLISFANYANDTDYRVVLLANYDTGTLDAYVNGQHALSSYQFWAAGQPDVTTNEFFFHLNGEPGVANQVALDNIYAYNYLNPAGGGSVPPPGAVPEPATAGLAGLALAGLAGRLLRRLTQR